MEWEVEGMDYWCNSNCPRAYLEDALVRLIKEVEGTTLPSDYFINHNEQSLRKEISHYEYVSDK